MAVMQQLERACSVCGCYAAAGERVLCAVLQCVQCNELVADAGGAKLVCQDQVWVPGASSLFSYQAQSLLDLASATPCQWLRIKSWQSTWPKQADTC